MSSRQHLETQVIEVLENERLDGEPLLVFANAIVNALMPLIVEPKQMRGVPEGSILIVEVQAGARALRWEDGHLHGNLKADQMPMTPDWVIERYGPLTVVWMP